MENRDKSKTEVEAKFQILQHGAKVVAEKFMTVQQLGKFKLGINTNVDNYDIYFDTNNLDLASINGSLRTRLINQTDYLVTLKLKKPSDTTANEGAFDRIEIEGNPTSSLVKEIWNNLRGLNLINVDYDETSLYRVGVEGLFQSWGFHELFRANNQRIVRSVFDANSDLIAELVIDNVTFFTPSKSSHFSEIEIELKDNTEKLLLQLSSSIKEIFSKFIVPNRKSKYERGLEFIRLEDDNKTEIKFSVNNLDQINRELQIEGGVSGYQVRTANLLKIVDVYYDTSEPEYSLRANKCYLRLRTIGDKRLFTFRHYQEVEENNIQTFQIKQPAGKEVLIDIVRYLVSNGILDKNTSLERALPEELHDALVTFGLHKKLDTLIDRLLFPVYDRDEYFANIKLDRVTFVAGGKTHQHDEIEVSTESQTAKNIHRVQSLAYGLMSRFDLKSLKKPKYVIGLDMILGTISTSDNDSLYIPIHRRTELDLAKSVASVVDVVDSLPQKTFSHNESNEKSIQALGKSLELAIERTKDIRKLQIVMALGLFIIGIGIILGSIITKVQGGFSMAQAIPGITIGAFVNLFIYFPFRKINELNEKVIELTTLSAKMDVSLAYLRDDPVGVRQYLDAMWASLSRK
jgi:inorganic triphosphatase YgiF